MSNKHLAGVKIAHDLEDFIEDHEVVLTLKDQSILDKDGIKGDADVLENINLSEEYRIQQALKAKKKKLGLESYDDDAPKSILPQYDEVKMEKEGFMLDSHGEYNQERLRKAESIKFALSKKKANIESLDTSTNIQSEYMTQEESTTGGFKMPKKKNFKKKAQEDIIKFLEENLEFSSADHGNRESRGLNDDEDLKEKIEKKQKMENYNQALENAQKKTKQARRIDDDDGYSEIEQMIEMSRRIMQKKEQTPESALKNFLDLNQKVEFQIKSKNSDQNQQEVISTVRADPNEKKEDLQTLKMETEFLKTLPTEAEINQDQARKIAPTPLSIKDSVSGTASIIHVALPTEKLLAHSKQPGITSARPNGTVNTDLAKDSKEPAKEPMEEEDEEKEEDPEKLKEEVKFLEEENVGKGMFKALSSLRDKGLLNQVQDITGNKKFVSIFAYNCLMIGRAKDKTYDAVLKKTGQTTEDRIKLEYRDEKGRLMTPKQAFRYQCYIFHNKKPSKNKLEKMRKKQEQEKKVKGVAADQSVLMRALQKNQQSGTQSYIVLSGNNNK